MTSDEFARKYEVHQQIAKGPVRSHFALSRSAKVVALAHYLEGGETRENAARLAQVKALADSPRHVVLDVCDVEGTPVVVTPFILNFTTFDAWLATESAAPPTQAPAPAAGDAASSAAPPTADARHPDAPAPTPPATLPGEITRRFGQPSPPSDVPYDTSTRVAPRPAGIAPPPEAAETAPSASAATSEFTELFGPPQSGPKSAPPAAPTAPTRTPATPPGPPKRATGEVTHFFSAAAIREPPPTPPPSPGPARTARRRGSFTQLFAKLVMPKAGPPPPAPLPETRTPGPATSPERFLAAEPQEGADVLYRRLHSTPEPPSPPTPPSPPPAPPPAAPGEFTQVFGASATTPAASSRPPSAGLGPPAVPEASPPEPRAAPSPQGGADYMARLQGARPAAPPAAPRAPSTAPASTMASEFTRALRRISASLVGPAGPEARPAEASPGPRPSPLPWVIAILGVLLVVAVGVVLYFALTSR